jgi:signal transduction histidine kinase/ABC-type branched-subunit amino acid transport system ATPase component
MELKTPEKPIIRLSNVSIDYNNVKALININFSITAGQTIAIIGEHGAGKSSLAMVISGMLTPHSGQILINEIPMFPYTLKTAQRNNIKMVYQENMLNEHFTVAENILYKSNYGTTFGFYSKNKVNQHVKEYLEKNDILINPKEMVLNLSLSERTVIEIMKTLFTEPAILILDEALEKLSTEHFSRIIPILLEHKKKGMSLVTITHKIDDIYNFADNITVLKEGSLLLTEKVDNINKLNLIRMAYTQVGANETTIKHDTDFYQILKYNEAILQFLPMNIIVIDDQLIIKMVNEHCIESFNMRGKTFLNTPISTLLRGNKKVINLIHESVKNKESQSFYNVEMKIQENSTINNIKTYPVYDGLVVLGTILIIEDMTEYDNLQKQLILSEKLASVGMLAAGVAHEINNPLEIISNYLSYLKYTQSNRDVIESVDNVNKEISNIAKIITNFVSFSDNRRIGLKIVDINVIIDDILQLLRYNAKYNHIKINFSKENEEQLFKGDEGQLKQVILNLIRNSFEAMPEGGSITIKSSNGVIHGTPSSTITFEDTGTGITSEDINSIFLPFYSTKSSKKSQLGLGLGLSISYHIIESFKGTLQVVNMDEGGCKFTINLPIGIDE